jgi:hypothetical protein
VDLLPNSLSFRVITTIDVDSESEIPDGFAGRVRLRTGGTLVYVAWLADGLLDDPTRRMPAYTRYRPNGRVKYEMHYRRGLLHDPDGEPAVRGYFANGAVHYEEHYREGRRHDGPGGVAAIRKWRPDGSLRRELHSYYGRPVPPPHHRTRTG